MVSPTFISFFIFGLINNVLYVVILTAAHDLVPPTTPKSLVLLADILPAFILKLSLPLFVKSSTSLSINYKLRLFYVVALSSIGILITSLNISLLIILFGVVLASLSSGLGETTFLQLSHYYNTDNSIESDYRINKQNLAIHGWSSGTGGAGLLGSGLVLILTTFLKLPINWVLRICSLLPFINLWVYFNYLPVSTAVSNSSSIIQNLNDVDIVDIQLESDNILTNNKYFSKLLPRIKQYFFKYMLPLTIVYFAEYVINQGVSPTLLFPLEQTPFTTFRDSYVAYGTIYQIGVFISRSSSSLIRFKKLYLLGFLQFINLIICILQSLYMFIPNIWLVFIIIFYEGLLGGTGYVNTFMNVSEEIEVSQREFALGCVGISDSFGIVLAAGISLWLEPSLCHYQLNDGRDWCTLK